ncbi:MAG: flagellin lysine-N-methylase [Tyzzerella sp.]|nr:flagellin lysine-N-methylase [Tyzzerella sp.]
MKYTIPHYFEDFKCVAAECEDTCCAGWAIMIDEDTLAKYKNMEGAFGNRLRNSIDWENGSFCQYEKRCAFLNEDNLCDLHLEAGEHMLCNTCRDYPRHMEEFEGVREGSLSLSCIEAAKLILGCKQPVQFFSFEDDVEDEDYEDFDYLLYTKLADAREKMLKVLQNREIDIMMRIGMVLELAQKMQDALDDGEIFRMDDLLESFGQMEATLEFEKGIAKYRMGANEYCATMRKMFRVFSKLEVLKEEWTEYVKKAEFTLYADGQNNYESNRRAFHKSIGLKSSQYENWSNYLEQLMVYFVFTYFCGAVYDDNILGKMQTAVVSTILIQELSIARWMVQEEMFSFHDVVDIAHKVSREIEHSDVNLIRLEKICEKMPMFATEELMKVVLSVILLEG